MAGDVNKAGRDPGAIQPFDSQRESPKPAHMNEPEGTHGEGASVTADSTTFTRCASCTNADDVNSSAGTLLCKRHNMRINAEAEEIPDDCPDYQPLDT